MMSSFGQSIQLAKKLNRSQTDQSSKPPTRIRSATDITKRSGKKTDDAKRMDYDRKLKALIDAKHLTARERDGKRMVWLS